MNTKIFLEVGNWEEAAKIIQEREPDKFKTLENAKDFLKDSTLEEFGNMPLKVTGSMPEWIYGPILALPAVFEQVKGLEKFENITIRFWHSLKTEDRSTVQIFQREKISAH